MDAYQTVAVGTDGSESSYRAVDRAAEIAADAKATLLIICAFEPERADADAEHALGEESAYMIVGSAPAEQKLNAAKRRAESAGAASIETLSVEGGAVEVVTKMASQYRADLVVVGNRGLRGLAGRILGSVPQSVSRQVSSDVLIVHTTD